MTGEASALRAEAGAGAATRPPASAQRAAGAAERRGLTALRQHWPEYLIEATGLGLFMVSACVFATLLEHPGSPVRQAITDATLRRIPMGLAMGATAMAIVDSRWGQRSGAHLNPAVTLTFWHLGKVAGCGRALLRRGAVCRRDRRGRHRHRRAGRRARAPGCELRGHGPRTRRPRRRVRRGDPDDPRPDDGHPDRLEPAGPEPLHRAVRRGARRHLHHRGSAALRDEPEPGAHGRLGRARGAVDGAVGVPDGAASRGCWPPPSSTSPSEAGVRSGAPSSTTTTRNAASSAAAMPCPRLDCHPAGSPGARGAALLGAAGLLAHRFGLDALGPSLLVTAIGLGVPVRHRRRHPTGRDARAEAPVRT